MAVQTSSPGPAELTLYFLGPGFGESTIVRLPSGETLVVDCCSSGDRCLTLQLLEQLEISTIDLLAVTHPDLDHMDGLDQLLSAQAVELAWTWPSLALVRDLLARWGGDAPGLQRLDAALEALDKLGDDNRRFEVQFGFGEKRWEASGASLSVLAPLPADINRSRKQIQKLVEWTGPGRAQLTDATLERLAGRRRPGDHPNLVSLGLVLQWSGWKVLLSGDIEAPRSTARGWSGILRELERHQGTADLLADMDIVKVAHHGSTGAWLDAAWNLHSRSRKVRCAVIAPFNRSRLPHVRVLSKLLMRAETLALTSNSPSARCSSAGWVARPSTSGDAVVVARLRADGSYVVEASGASTIYGCPP